MFNVILYRELSVSPGSHQAIKKQINLTRERNTVNDMKQTLVD